MSAPVVVQGFPSYKYGVTVDVGESDAASGEKGCCFEQSLTAVLAPSTQHTHRQPLEVIGLRVDHLVRCTIITADVSLILY